MGQLRTWLVRAAVALIVVGGGYFAWERLRPPPLLPGLASANGRIEATEIDIATSLVCPRGPRVTCRGE